MEIQKSYQALSKAITRLREAMDFPDDVPHKESLTQRFEYTFELSWKLMSVILNIEGIEAYGAKTIIREASAIGLINDSEMWFEYLKARNQSSHIYNEKILEEVVKVAKLDFLNQVEILLEKTKSYL